MSVYLYLAEVMGRTSRRSLMFEKRIKTWTTLVGAYMGVNQETSSLCIG